MSETPATDDEITAEARMIAARVRERVKAGPSARELAQIAADALGAPSPADMTPAEVRHLAATAFTQAQQVSYLLGQLEALVGDDDREGR